MGQGKAMELALGKATVDKVDKMDSGFVTFASNQVTSCSHEINWSITFR